jgi:hypothetical protein
MKWAVVSVVFLVVTVLLFLIGADSGVVWLAAALCAAALSIAFALIAVGGAMTSKQLDDGQQATIVAIGLVVLAVFALAIAALLTAFSNSFE